MKKLLLVLGVAFSLQLTYAQKSVYKELPQRYFNEGKEMFLNNNYTGCLHSLQEFKALSTDRELNTEADFMIVSSLFLQGNERAEIQLKEFLEANPQTYHRNQICFYIGSVHFDKKEWEKSLYWLSQADVDYLSLKDQEDYSFRFGYVNLQKGDRSVAKQQFGALTRLSVKYKEPASFYLAYIHFQEGDYAKALPVFERLKNNPVYGQEAFFYLIQSHFLNNDLTAVATEGQSYANTYSNSKNLKEVYRMLGNSFNRLNDVNNSILYYEKYWRLESNPFREDMFLLGSSFYQIGSYQKAVDALKLVASTDDKLGQAAFMELGQAYLKLKDNANALMAFDAASRVKFDAAISESALYNYALVVHQTSLSVFDQSVNVFQRFLKEYPNSKYREQVYDILASAFLTTRNYTAALNAINEMPSPGRQILEAKQIILFRLGTQEFINSNYDAAVRNFNASINMGDYAPKAKNESFFWRGEIAYRKNDYTSAVRDYETYLSRAVPSDANYALAFYNLGYAHFQNKQYPASLTNFQKFINQEKDVKKAIYTDALNRMGDSYLYNRNYSQAEKSYNQASMSDPQNADYSDFQKAFVLGLQKNYVGKISALDNMMAKYPNSEYSDDALFEKSMALVMQGKDREASAVLEKLIKEHPQSVLNAEAGVQLGQLYFNTNDLQKSITAYQRVISNYPNSEEARIAIKSLESVYKELNDINSYAAYVNSLGGGTVISVSRQDSLSYLSAENIYMRGEKSKAKDAMAQYLQSYPNGRFAGDAHYLLGYMEFEANNKDAALANFNQVIKSNNRKYMDDALIYTSGIYFDKADHQAAYDGYSKLNAIATTGDGKNVAQLGMLRSASLMQKDAEVITAATVLLNNAKISPDIEAEARYYRAKSLLNTKQTDAAVNDLLILAKDTRNIFGAEAQYLLASTYYKWKSYDKAIKQVQAFMKQGTPHEYWMAKSLIVLSDSYAAQGDSFQAKQYIESLKANYKGSETDIADAINERLNKK